MATRIPAEERRALIVDAAARLLQERGFGDITVDMLREESGLSKGGLYHHVRSKTDVLVLVCEMAAEQMVEGLERARAHDGSARERIDVLLSEHFDLVLRYGGALWAFFAERARLSDDERERVLSLERRYLRGMEAMFDDMRDAGDLRELDTATLSQAFLGMLNWVARWHHDKAPVSSIRATLTDLFVNGALVQRP
jgi:AcrR family transcriptional regulator